MCTPSYSADDHELIFSLRSLLVPTLEYFLSQTWLECNWKFWSHCTGWCSESEQELDNTKVLLSSSTLNINLRLWGYELNNSMNIRDVAVKLCAWTFEPEHFNKITLADGLNLHIHQLLPALLSGLWWQVYQTLSQAVDGSNCHQTLSQIARYWLGNMVVK